MLAREQRRRHEDGDLLAVLHRLERGAQRDLGLAVADVAADEAVHRDRPLHVGLDVVDRLQLVGRLLVRERLLDLALPRRVGRERVPGRREAPAVEHDELLRDLAHRAAHARPRLLPVGAAHAVRALGRLAAGVLADEPDLVGRARRAVAALELEPEVVALDAAHRARLHAEVAADAVHVVHDEVAGLEVLVVVDAACARRAARRCTRRRPVRSASATSASARAGSDDAALERRDDDADRAGRELASARGVDALAGEHVVRGARAEPVPSAASTTR